MSTEEYHLCLSFSRDSPNSENTSRWISSWFVQWVFLERIRCYTENPCVVLHASPSIYPHFLFLPHIYLPSSLSPYEFSYVLQFLLNSLRVSCNILCLSLWQYWSCFIKVSYFYVSFLLWMSKQQRPPGSYLASQWMWIN